ncbi:MAG: PTS mannose transporter subunit IIB [Hespellia sp.]|jgi:PTS system mannose-specific IIA component|nr:PTS mannose transporter subunit IIB [Hespellia sp.]
MNEKNIPGILILSHGPFCEAVIESAKMIAGEMENVVGIPLEAGCDMEEYAAKVINTYQALPKGSIVLFDLQSGTPFNQLVSYCAGNEVPLDALCGVNLPILLEAWTLRNSVSGSELVKALENAGHESLVNVTEYIKALQID